MSRPKTSTVVRQWAASPPVWPRVLPPSSRLVSTNVLDDGEADAISLAKEHHIASILIDERRGRRVAQHEGLKPLPTLAVLELAASKDLLDLKSVIAGLLQTNFRIPQDEVAAALPRDAAGRQTASTGHHHPMIELDFLVRPGRSATT